LQRIVPAIRAIKTTTHIMKTITMDSAQAIIYRLNLPKYSWLSDFEKTGVINKRPNYHHEIDEMLANPHRYLKKELDDIQKLKNYFNKVAPLSYFRDPANVKTFEFHNITHAGESTSFVLSWNELGIILKQPGAADTIFSISLENGKELALEILKY